MTSQAIVTSSACTWWGPISSASKTKPTGLPCCPGCGAPLFQWSSRDELLRAAGRKSPRHRADVEAAEGVCASPVEFVRRRREEADRG